jgi:hypothetical protein
MKKITTVTTVLTLLILWSGMALAADPLPKSKATPPSQKPNASAPQQPGSKVPTTPGVVVPAAFVDLAVTDIRVQELGQGALIQVTVKNLGTASANANLYQLRVLLNGSLLPGGDQPLFNARTPIEPNQTRVTGVVPTQSGSTEVTARLILSGAAASDNPANNILTRTLDLPEVRPDFTITDLSLMPDNRIQVAIRNNGGYAPRDAQFSLEVSAGNDRLGLPWGIQWPNPRETIVATTTDPIVGTRNVRATVNPNRTVLEMNYENNTLSKEFTAHVLKPDLIVRWLGFWQESDIFGTTNKLVIIIANIGKATSPRTIKTEVFYGDRLIATPTLEGPIGVGSQRFNTGVPVVPYDTYRVTVDPQNEIDEEREDNNSLTARVELLR